jgi:pSer/pThr/pTyr-binding forkhead associated (FHA) protein
MLQELTMKLHLIQTGPEPFADDFEIDRFPFLLGRSSACDHQIYHPMVSRRHCELMQDDSAVAIHDLHSSNGTYVNGHRVKEQVELHDGDEINLGCVSFRVAVALNDNGEEL